MSEIRVVKKSYAIFTASLKSPADVTFETDRAVAQFRAFEPVAMVYADRVTDSLALNVMLDAVDSVRERLLAQKKRLQGT